LRALSTTVVFAISVTVAVAIVTASLGYRVVAAWMALSRRVGRITVASFSIRAAHHSSRRRRW
jgi:hypothetical protein